MQQDRIDLALACLSEGSDAADSFDRFLGNRDPENVRWDDVRLYPFVYRAVANGDVDHQHRTLLKSHYVKSWMNNAQLFRAADPCLAFLESQSHPAVLLKGSAMSSDVFYADTGVRHMADVDLILPRSDIATFVDWAIANGWSTIWQRTSVEDVLAVSHAAGLKHDESGVEMDVHHSLLGRDRSADRDQILIDNRIKTTLGKRTVYVPTPELMLVHALCHANASGIRNLIDGIHIIESPTHALDWDVVTDEIIGRRSIVLALENANRIREVRPQCIPQVFDDALQAAPRHWSDFSHDQEVAGKRDFLRFTVARMAQVSRGSGAIGTALTSAKLASLGIRDAFLDRNESQVR